jgi:type II secretory pathway pseudopilin PulG
MTAKTTVLVIAVTAALIGCKREGSGTKGKPGVTSPAIDTLIAAVPGNAVALGFVDMASPPWTFITGGALPLDEATRKTLDKELREYVDRYLGVDLSKLQHAVGFVSGPPPRGAVLLKTIGGTLKMPGAMDYEGGKVWVVDPGEGMSLAIKGDVVVFGKDEAVRAVLDTLAGKRKNVTVENKALVDWLHKESEGAAVAFAAIAPKGLPLPPQIAGLDRVAVSIGRTGIRAVVDGEDAAISSLQARSDQAFVEMLAETERAHDAAVAGNIAPPEGAFAIIGAAYAKSYAVKLKPRREGNRLSVSLDLELGGTEAMTVVAVMGVLSAVAIPAFMDYMKKSKKSEASLQLNKLAKNLKRYVNVNGELPKGDAPLTPAEGCCGGPKGKCGVDPRDWQQPIWQMLDFQIDAPNLFQYRYHSDGKTAVVEAVGDLDCDTNMITYRLDVTSSNGSPTAILTEPAPNTD